LLFAICHLPFADRRSTLKAITSWLRSGLLRKVLLAILLCALIPLAVVGWVAIQGYTQMAQDAIPPSKAALDERSMDSLELWAFDTAQRVARFLYEREDDLRDLALLPRDPAAYLAFYQAHHSSIWAAEGVSERPLYRELAFVDRSGQEVIKIADGAVIGPGDLRDVGQPENTTFKRESYFAETMALDEGQVYVSRVLGWYVPLFQAYAAGEKPDGRHYEGIIRFATPVFDAARGDKVGIVVLSLDHAHVMEFTAHMISTGEHYTTTVSASSGQHSYIIDGEGWAIAHARHYYLAGFDQNGGLVPSISQDRFAEQQTSGYLPANLNAMGFIDPNFPQICAYNREGKSGSVPIYYWRDAAHPQGRARALAFATIPYYTGRYNTPAGFGWVGVTSDADKFHEPANLVEAKVVQAREALIRDTRLIWSATVLLILVVAFLLARTITRPVCTLAESAAEIGQGRFGQQVEVKGRDEIGQLAATFNKMSKDLQQYVADLERTTAERERYQRELEIAHDIQQSFLPRAFPAVAGFDIAAHNVPARHVGGDFYDFIPLSNGRWGLLVADVSDKGVPAALFMALSRSLVRAYSLEYESVPAALAAFNAFVAADNPSSMFVTLFYATLEPEARRLAYINAGHNPPILVRGRERQVVLLRAHGIALGIWPEVELEEHPLQLEPEDVVVLYTDGVTEAFNAGHEMFGEERLIEVVRGCPATSAQELLVAIEAEVATFTDGAAQSDDITLLVLRCL
jgi:serine phosphatase RsbU (regulator of sigma subunit)